MDTANNSLAVFKGISELMKDTEFITANFEFFEKHCDQFDANVEENKHEYKQIFEDFLKVQEDVIEGKLREKFTEEQILAFYEDLQDSLKSYEQTDKDTVDFLYEMIDFDKFKAKMCSCKANKLQESKLEMEKLTNADMLKSRDDFNFQQELAIFQKIMAESVSSEEHGWKMRLNKKDWAKDFKIQIYTKKQAHSKNDLIRCYVKVKGVSAAKMVDFFKHFPSDKFKNMLKDEKYEDIVESADKKTWTAIRYRCTGAPMMTDRDQVTVYNFQTLDDGNTLISTRSVEDARFPEVKNRIRCFVNESYMVSEKEEDGETVADFASVQVYDFKGYIPPSLLNMAAANNILKFWEQMLPMMK